MSRPAAERYLFAEATELLGVADREDPADAPVREGKADHGVDGTVEHYAGAGRALSPGFPRNWWLVDLHGDHLRGKRGGVATAPGFSPELVAS